MNKKLKLDELGRVSADSFRNMKKANLSIILDNIRSAHNVGSFFRTADAFNVAKIHLCGITPQPPHRDIRKTALGASKTVSWEHHENTTDVLNLYDRTQHTIAAIEQTSASVPLHQLNTDDHNEKWVLVFGNEVDGVQQSVIDQCDLAIEIPQFGTKHSFNVSVSGGIVLWELYKKLYL